MSEVADAQQPQVAQLPLVCDDAIAKAIFCELTLGGLVAGDEVLVIGGANWQKNRIKSHLETKLAELKTIVAGFDTHSKAALAQAEVRLNWTDLDTLAGTKAFIRGQYEAKIELLASLIKELN